MSRANEADPRVRQGETKMATVFCSHLAEGINDIYGFIRWKKLIDTCRDGLFESGQQVVFGKVVVYQ